MKISIITCFVALTTLVAMPFKGAAQEVGRQYNFLNVTSSAKIYGLGGVNVSLVDDDISTIDQNPCSSRQRDGRYGFAELHALSRRFQFRRSALRSFCRRTRSLGGGSNISASGSMKETTPDGAVIGRSLSQGCSFRRYLRSSPICYGVYRSQGSVQFLYRLCCGCNLTRSRLNLLC